MNAPDFPNCPAAPPHSVPAEQQVLGALMLNGALLDRCVSLVPGAFHMPEHRATFAAIVALDRGSRPFDPVSVYESMRGNPQRSDLAYLTTLCLTATSAASFDAHVARIIDTWRKRELVTLLDRAATQAMQPGGPSTADILAQARERLDDLADLVPDDDAKTFSQLSVEYIDVMSARLSGDTRVVPTGLRDLDAHLDGGLERGGVCIIGARPGRGKTAFGLSVMRNVATAGGAVAVFSAEMDGISLTDRNMAAMIGVGMQRLRRPKESDLSVWQALPTVADTYSAFRGGVVERGPFTLQAIRAKSRRLKRQCGGLDLILVDYVQLLDSVDQRSTRNAELERISRGLKTMARELDAPVLLLAQLNRASELRPGARYSLSDLKDSGSLEQDADVVGFLVSEFMDKSDEDKRGDWRDWAEYEMLQLAKVRQGRLGDVHLLFRPQFMLFEDWDRGDPPARPKPKPPTKSRTFE